MSKWLTPETVEALREGMMEQAQQIQSLKAKLKKCKEGLGDLATFLDSYFLWDMADREERRKFARKVEGNYDKAKTLLKDLEGE